MLVIPAHQPVVLPAEIGDRLDIVDFLERLEPGEIAVDAMNELEAVRARITDLTERSGQ